MPRFNFITCRCPFDRARMTGARRRENACGADDSSSHSTESPARICECRETTDADERPSESLQSAHGPAHCAPRRRHSVAVATCASQACSTQISHNAVPRASPVGQETAVWPRGHSAGARRHRLRSSAAGSASLARARPRSAARHQGERRWGIIGSTPPARPVRVSGSSTWGACAAAPPPRGSPCDDPLTWHRHVAHKVGPGRTSEPTCREQPPAESVAVRFSRTRGSVQSFVRSSQGARP